MAVWLWTVTVIMDGYGDVLAVLLDLLEVHLDLDRSPRGRCDHDQEAVRAVFVHGRYRR